MASEAAFTASWRGSNCTVRAGNHRNKKTIKIRTREIRMRHSWIHLTRHHGVRLSQPRSNGTGLLLGRMKSSLRNPEVDLDLAILPSHLKVAVLSRPPLPEEASAIVTIVLIRGIQR